MDQLEVSSGTLGSWEVDLLDKNAQPIAFDPADTLVCSLWAGDNTVDLGDPAATWIDALMGRVQITVPEVLTSALAPARYLMRLTVRTAVGLIEGWRGWITIKWSPGNATTLSTYVSYQDMLMYAPQIDRLQLESDQAGFVEQRHLARQWLEQMLQGAWRGNRMISYTSPKLMSFYLYLNRDVYLQSLLDGNCLQVDPRVVEINARRAISYVYDSAIGGDSKVCSEYRTIANKFLREANQLLKASVFGLTTLEQAGDLKQYASTIVDMTKRDTRF